MAVSHRTNRLKLIGTPAVEQLQNGRYQLTVNCSTMNSREDWYSANKARVFPDFGSLESAEMSIDGLAPRTGETYTDMRLVSVQSSTQQEKYIVTLVYQTLGASFVQVKDDTVNYIENGLRRVTRKSIAKAGTDFQKTIGTFTITSQIDNETGVRCVLANYEVDDTDSYREVTEVYIEAGTLSETEDKVGSQLSIVKETFSNTPSAPSGYSIANEQESNVAGIPTRRFTFLKNNVVLSETEDKVGSQLSLVKEVFNGTPSTPSGYSIANEQISNVDGIPTRRFTFLKNNVTLSETEDKVGSQLAIVKEVFNGTPSTPSGYSIASEQESNVDGIATKRFTFLKPNILSVSQDFNNGQGRVSVQAFSKTSSEVTSALSEVTSDHELISQRESDFAGIKTSTFEYQLDESFIQDRELNGLNRIRLIELSASDFTAQTIGVVSTSAPTSSLFLGSQVIDNGGTIKTRQSTWLEAGTLSVSIKNLAEGVKQVTTVFLVTEGTTVGPVTSRNTSNFEGLKTISVTTMQDKSGNALGANGNTPVCSFDVFSNFTYPGLFDVSLSSSSNVGNVEIELTKAPAQSKVQSKVFVFFTTTSTIQSSDYTYESAAGLWSPNDWGAVSVNARGISSGIRFNASKALRGYRTDGASSSNSASASFGSSALFAFQGSQKLSDFNRIPFSTTVSPGPVTPVGSKWVLDVKLTAAFDDTSGTTYYKKTIIVTDAIPAQVSGDVGGPY